MNNANNFDNTTELEPWEQQSTAAPPTAPATYYAAAPPGQPIANPAAPTQHEDTAYWRTNDTKPKKNIFKSMTNERLAKLPKKAKPKKEKKPRVERVENINLDKAIPIKTNYFKKVVRFVAWVILLFFAARGIVAMAKPDPVSAMQAQTTQFIEQQKQEQNISLELYAFAGNFTKEYLTYEPNGQQDYLARLKPYTTSNFSIDGISNFSSYATALYTQAYSIEQYNTGQYDVYVMATIEYTKDEVTTTEDCYMKVPVGVTGGGKYIVEDYPLFIAAPSGENVTQTPFTGREVDNAVNSEVKTLLDNFFAALYQDNQTSIDYFLSGDADKTQFKGLAGRFTYEGIREIHTYQDPQNSNKFLSIVTIIVEDINGTEMYQRFNVSIQKEGSRYYVLDMDTKAYDLKENYTV